MIFGTGSSFYGWGRVRPPRWHWLVAAGLGASVLLAPVAVSIANPAVIEMKHAEDGADEVGVIFHWKHQEVFQCYACHPSLFTKIGKAAVTHDEMKAGRYCGACHNGEMAFDVGDENVSCEVCHVE